MLQEGFTVHKMYPYRHWMWLCYWISHVNTK